MTTILARPAVTNYLAELEVALRELPVPHAHDLRDQVRSHIEDSLEPDASDYEVLATLHRLGPPRDLVNDDAQSTSPVVYTRPSLRGWLRQRSKKWWAILVSVTVVVAAVTTVVEISSHIAHVDGTCNPCGWFTAIDADHNHTVTANNFEEWKVPDRVGQAQIFMFTLFNPSKYPQRLLGGVSNSEGTDERLTITFSTLDPNVPGSPEVRQLSFRDDVTIPPDQYRVVKYSWTHSCDASPDSFETANTLFIRVRTLLITRSEAIPMPVAVSVQAGNSRHRC